MSQLKLSPQISYDATDLESPSYSLMKVLPLSGAQTATVTPGNGVDITLEIPIQAINLARSYFYAEVTIPEQAGATFTWEHKGIVPFQSVQLFTRGGQYLMNLQDRANFYSRVVMTADTQWDDFEHSDSQLEPLYVSDTATGAQSVPGYGAVGGFKSYSEQAYVKVHDTTNGSGAVTVRWLIPLKALKKTIMAVDKSILFREILVLKIKLAKGSDLFYTGTSGTDPDAGVGAMNLSYVLNDMALYVAQERNASIVEALNSQTESAEGFSLLVPYPSTFVNSRAGTSQNVSLRLNRSHGQSLKSIKYTVFEGAANNFLYDRDNNENNTVLEYYTNVNNNRIQEFNINTSRNEDWMIHKDRFKYTPIQNMHMYNYNWLHEDNFDNYDSKMSDMREEDTNVLSGINLNDEVRFDFYATTVNKTNTHITIAHCQKVLNINQRGLVIG